MIRRPKQFYWAAFLLLAVAVSFPIQAMFLYGHSLSELGAVFGKISFLNWVVISLLLTCAVLHLKASPWLKVLAPLTIAAVAFNNYIVGSFHTDYTMAETVTATAGFSFLFIPLLMPSSRIVLADPKRRWWARSKRHHKRVSTTLNPYVGEMIQTHTFDISETGAFVCVEGDEESVQLPKVGERIRLCMNINSMKKIRCEAIIVRTAEASGSYPKGIGVKFVDFDKVHQKSFSKFLESTTKWTH